MYDNEGEIIFECDHGNGHIVTVRISSDSTLGDLLPAFEEFLKGCGYYFNERIVFEEPERVEGQVE